jgi:hypothetical protein
MKRIASLTERLRRIPIMRSFTSDSECLLFPYFMEPQAPSQETRVGLQCSSVLESGEGQFPIQSKQMEEVLADAGLICAGMGERVQWLRMMKGPDPA